MTGPTNDFFMQRIAHFTKHLRMLNDYRLSCIRDDSVRPLKASQVCQSVKPPNKPNQTKNKLVCQSVGHDQRTKRSRDHSSFDLIVQKISLSLLQTFLVGGAVWR